MLDVHETTSVPKLVDVGLLEISLNLYFFSNPSELSLSMPYPATIMEETLSLCYHKDLANHGTIVPA